MTGDLRFGFAAAAVLLLLSTLMRAAMPASGEPAEGGVTDTGG